MIEFVAATENDIPTIHQLAHQIWWPTYSGVLSDEQIGFMLVNMYSEKALKQQFNDGYSFILLFSNGLPKGFAAFSKNTIDKNYKIEKLYLHPDQQGKGAGKQLINHVESLVKEKGAEKLSLNVNRGNKAKDFYQKMGYIIVKEIDIPYYQFVMNDFIMEKVL